MKQSKSMLNLIKKVLINPILGYEIHLVEDEAKVWLVLVNFHSHKLIACWSSKKNKQETRPDYNLVTQLLQERFQLLENKQVSLDDAVEIWPHDWDYWGRFTPDIFRGYIKNIFS